MAGYVKHPREKSPHQGNYRNKRNEKKRTETDTRSPRVTTPLAPPRRPSQPPPLLPRCPNSPPPVEPFSRCGYFTSCHPPTGRPAPLLLPLSRLLLTFAHIAARWSLHPQQRSKLWSSTTVGTSSGRPVCSSCSSGTRP